MAIQEKDLLAAIARLKEKNAQQEKPVERMSLAEWQQSHAVPNVSADAVEEKSKKVLEAQETTAQSVSDKNEDGIYKESIEQTKDSKESLELQKEQLDALMKLGKSFETFKSPLEKLIEKFQAYSPGNIKETLLNKFNIKIPGIGGIFDKTIAKERFIKQERLLGSTKSRSEISRDFQSYNEQSKIIQKNTSTMSKIKAALPDASEEQLMKVPEYAKAKQESETAAKESGKYTVKSSIMHPTNEDVGSTTKKKAPKRVPQSADKTPSAATPNIIERQTNAVAPKLTFGDKMKKIGGGMVDTAKGVAAMGGALVVLSVGLNVISNIDFDTIAKATLAVSGLALASKLMGDNAGSMLKGALGIAALGAALIVAGEGFKAFSELDWESLAKAGAAVSGLALAAAGIGTFIAPILAGAAAIAAIGASVWVLAKGVDALGGAINKLTSPKEANRSPSATGSSGVDGKPGLDGVDGKPGIAGTTGSSEVAANRVRAEPTRPSTANAVYGASAENAEALTVVGGGSSTTNNVVAPTTVTNNTVNSYKPDVRNQDSSFKRMLDSRYVPV